MTFKLSIREMCILALMAALMLCSQIAMAALPNIHLVATLIIITTLVFGLKALIPVFIFVMLEGLVFGFGIWWISYLYVWPVLVFAVLPFRNSESSLLFAIIAASHGLLFGAMCAIPYLFIGGISAAVSYWIAGISFDLAHCAGNFVLALVLIKPLSRLMKRLL